MSTLASAATVADLEATLGALLRELGPTVEASPETALPAPLPAAEALASGEDTQPAAPINWVPALNASLAPGEFLDELPFPVARLDRLFRYVFLNKVYLHLLRRSAANSVGYHMAEVIGQENFERSLPHLRRALCGERTSFERSGYYPEIGETCFRVHYLPELSADGEVAGILVLAFDLSEVRRTDARLRESEQRFAAIYKHAGLGITLTDPEWRIVALNPAFERMTGYTEAELIGASVADISHPGELTQSLVHLRRAANGELSGYVLEKRYIRKDRRAIWTKLTVTPIRDAAGRTSLLLGITEDISERRRTEQELRVSLERFDTATAAANDGLWDWDLETDRVWYSPRFQALLGEDAASLGDGLALWSRVHPDDRERMAAALEQHRREGTPFDLEYRMTRADGRVGWFHTTARAIRPPEGTAKRLIGSTRDVTDRVISERKFHALFECSSEPHLIFDASGIVVCNQAALRAIGAGSLAPIAGYHPATLSPRLQPDGEVSLAKSRCMDRRARETGFHRFEWLHRRLDGSDFLVEVSLTPIELDGRPAMLATWHDIDERKALENQLRAAKAAADAANRSKSEFLANMSHELRTPLNAVIGMTHLLLEGGLTDEQREWAESVRDAGDVLLSLVNDILDLSQLDAGRLAISATDFELADLVRKTVRMVELRAQDRRNRLIIELDPALPTFVCGDERRVRQVLFNLLGNATKFTEQGTVTLRVTPAKPIEGVPAFRFEVEDTGIGIPPEVQARLFRDFEQGDASVTRRFGGSGLGLAISRRLVELLGGSIALSSEVGRGSRFWFTVPLAACQRERSGAPEAGRIYASGTAAGPARSLRVLAAEDNALNQRLICELLRRFGHHVDLATNGRQAVERATAEPFDLILMDIQMPELDGIAATRAIRALGTPAAATPIVALSANAMSEQREQYLAAGMDEVLTKPIDPRALIELLDGIAAETAAPALSQAEAADDASGEPEIAGASGLEALARVLDAERMAELIEVHVADARHRLDLLGATLASADLGLAARTAHELAGILVSFGGTALAQGATRLALSCEVADRNQARREVASLSPQIAAWLDALAGRFGRPPEDSSTRHDERALV
jgi:PAS domain S-box-containing protein